MTSHVDQARRPAIAAVLATVLMTAGCQSYAPTGFTPGTPIATIEAAMGRPTGTYPLADGGRRVEFARGPYGRHTYMVDTDAAGRMTRVEQVLTEANFAEVALGQTQEDVLRRIGRPSDARMLGYQKRLLWSYRHDSIFCTWYQVSFNMEGQVVDTGYGPDPVCEMEERND